MEELLVFDYYKLIQRYETNLVCLFSPNVSLMKFTIGQEIFP